MDIIVVGAGIGGLSAANALARAGHRIRLLERQAGFDAVGAGIVLAPNAVHVLASIGVHLDGEGAVVRRTEIRHANGRLLSTLNLQGLAADNGPTYGIARARLHELLVQALPNDVEVLNGHSVESLDEGAAGIVVETSHGQLHADLVVGADGLHSTVRTQAVEHEPWSLRYSGTTCWRGFANLGSDDTATESWGDRTRVGVVPVTKTTSYYYLVRTAPAGAPGPTRLADLRADFEGFSGAAGELLNALESMPPLHHDLIELDRPVWGSGRVLLLGDAAHAMTPNQGQGAAMAIEDASALCTALAPGVDGARDRYAARRHRRVRKVQLTSRRIGAFAHWGNAPARLIRDAGMRLTPQAAGDHALRSLIAPGVDLARVARGDI